MDQPDAADKGSAVVPADEASAVVPTTEGAESTTLPSRNSTTAPPERDASRSRKRGADSDHPTAPSSLRVCAAPFVPGALVHQLEEPPAKRVRGQEPEWMIREAQAEAEVLFAADSREVALSAEVALGPTDEEQRWLDEQIHGADMQNIEEVFSGPATTLGQAGQSANP